MPNVLGSNIQNQQRNIVGFPVSPYTRTNALKCRKKVTFSVCKGERDWSVDRWLSTVVVVVVDILQILKMLMPIQSNYIVV